MSMSFTLDGDRLRLTDAGINAGLSVMASQRGDCPACERLWMMFTDVIAVRLPVDTVQYAMPDNAAAAMFSSLVVPHAMLWHPRLYGELTASFAAQLAPGARVSVSLQKGDAGYAEWRERQYRAARGG